MKTYIVNIVILNIDLDKKIAFVLRRVFRENKKNTTSHQNFFFLQIFQIT